LATRAAEEYGYVQRDIRRITIVGGFLLGILAVLEVLVNGLHLFTL
jgi:preprotein translocase subunit SecY